MSTGKRLAKRSILGTRVCVPTAEGLFVPGVIQATQGDEKTRPGLYSVCLDEGRTAECRPTDLVGPGFRSVCDLSLSRGQRVFVTHNGREFPASVVCHQRPIDEVELTLAGSGTTLRKRLDEVRLIESRKSARLQDSDTDYSRLADGQTEPRRRASSLSIDVPYGVSSGRKRRSSADDGVMDDCMAAMVLMSLSCSPKSPCLQLHPGSYPPWSNGVLASSSGASSYSGGGGSTRATPSPPGHDLAQTDEGIDSDASSSYTMDDAFPPPKRKSPTSRLVYQCTWPGCGRQFQLCDEVERHVRTQHLKRSIEPIDSEGSDREEEFYYTEMETEPARTIYSSSVPTLSHFDMARPAHEDPEYNKKQVTYVTSATPISIPQLQKSAAWHLHGYAASAPSHMGSPQKCMRLSVKGSPSKTSPLHRRARSESRKCRKVYGMENRDMWCTQCKWKKACTRFVD